MESVHLVALFKSESVNWSLELVRVKGLISNSQQDFGRALVKVFSCWKGFDMFLFSKRVGSWHEGTVVSILQVWSEEPSFLSRVVWDWSHEGSILRFILGAISTVTPTTSVVSSLHGEEIAHISDKNKL